MIDHLLIPGCELPQAYQPPNQARVPQAQRLRNSGAL